MPRYINADALKDVIQQHDYPLADRLNSIDNGMFTLGIFQAIDQMPAISPDVVRGVAIVKYERGDYSCSACGHPARRLSFARKNHCDECGAKLLWEMSEDD